MNGRNVVCVRTWNTGGVLVPTWGRHSSRNVDRMRPKAGDVRKLGCDGGVKEYLMQLLS